MLVIDPSSSCDVCLDTYSPVRAPCILGCGHVFCIICLENISPYSCPMCRRPFDGPNSVQRLRVYFVSDIQKGEDAPSEVKVAAEAEGVVRIHPKETERSACEPSLLLVDALQQVVSYSVPASLGSDGEPEETGGSDTHGACIRSILKLLYENETTSEGAESDSYPSVSSA